MKSRTSTFITAIMLFAALAMPLRLAAQDEQDHHKHHHYKLVDLGTFGGPSTYLPDPGNGGFKALNNRGMITGWADTPIPDPFAPHFCYVNECLVTHTFQWQNGELTDLGALPGVNNSSSSWMNARGDIVGMSEDGLIDSATGFPEVHAVIWKNGRTIDLGTFGGTNSIAYAVNDRGQVVGYAANTIPEPFPIIYPSFPFARATQLRAFLSPSGPQRD